MSPRPVPRQEQRAWPRLRRKRSVAWRFFAESPADPNCAVCQLCNAAIPRGRRLARNTTNLLKHLRNKHPNRLSAALETAPPPWGAARDPPPTGSAIDAPHVSSEAQAASTTVPEHMAHLHPHHGPPLRCQSLSQGHSIANNHRQHHVGASVSGGNPVQSHPEHLPHTQTQQRPRPGAENDQTLRHTVLQLALHGISLTTLGEPTRILQSRVVAPLVAETSTHIHLALSSITEGCTLVVERLGLYSIVSCCWISSLPSFRRRSACLAVLPPGVVPHNTELQNIVNCWGITDKLNAVMFSIPEDYARSCSEHETKDLRPALNGVPARYIVDRPGDPATWMQHRTRQQALGSGSADHRFLDQQSFPLHTGSAAPAALACNGYNSVPGLATNAFATSASAVEGHVPGEFEGVAQGHTFDMSLYSGAQLPLSRQDLQNGATQIHTPELGASMTPQHSTAQNQSSYNQLSYGMSQMETVKNIVGAHTPASEKRGSETDSHSFGIPRGTASSLSSVIPLSECASRSHSPPISPSEPRDPFLAKGVSPGQYHPGNVMRPVTGLHGVLGNGRAKQVGQATVLPGQDCRPDIHVSASSSRRGQRAGKYPLLSVSNTILCSTGALQLILDEHLLKNAYFLEVVSRVRVAVSTVMSHYQAYEGHCQTLLMGSCVPLVTDDGEGGYIRSLNNMLVLFQRQFLAIRATCFDVGQQSDVDSLESLSLQDLKIFTSILVVFMDAKRVTCPPTFGMHTTFDSRAPEKHTSLAVCIPTIKGVKRAIGKLRHDVSPQAPVLSVLNRILCEVERSFCNLENRLIFSSATLLDPRFKCSAFESKEAAGRAKEYLLHLCARIEAAPSVLPLPFSREDIGGLSTVNSFGDSGNFPNVGFYNRSGSMRDFPGNGQLPEEASRSAELAGKHSLRHSIELYLESPVLPFSIDVDDYWRGMSGQWPVLACAALRFLSTPATASLPRLADNVAGVPAHVDPLAAFGDEDAVQMTFLRQNALFGTRVA